MNQRGSQDLQKFIQFITVYLYIYFEGQKTSTSKWRTDIKIINTHKYKNIFLRYYNLQTSLKENSKGKSAA